MKKQEKQSQLVANFSEMISLVNLFLPQFEEAFKNEEIKKALPTIDGVYMYVIVMHLGKMFSESKNEHFSLDKFKNNFLEITDKVDEIYNNHKDIIGKIKNNRDKLFAHTDKNFYDLGFSQIHIDKLEKTFESDFSRIKANSKDHERYTPADLNADLVEIRQMMQKADALWKEALMLIDYDSTG
jgi:hypothetical protein